MILARSFSGLILFAAVAILIVGVVVAVTIRTRARAALAGLMAFVAAVYVAGIIWNAPLVSDPDYLASHPFAGLGTALVLFVDMALFSIAGIAAVISAASAGHCAWLAGIVSAMLPMLALVLGGLFPTSPSGYAQHAVLFFAALFFPLLVILAYALSLSRTRQVAARSGS